MTRLQVSPSGFAESVYWAEDLPALSGRSSSAYSRGTAPVEDYTIKLATDYATLRDAMLVREEQLGRDLFEEVVPVGATSATAGTFAQHGNYVNYRLRVAAPGAKQLRFDFGKLVLPEGAEAYFYNDARDFVMGPITDEQFSGPGFVTDIVAGAGVTFDVYLPEGSGEAFEMEQSSVYYGVVGMVPYSNGYGTAQSCNVNVTCGEGSGWVNERRATVLLLLQHGTGFCSGTAIENECRDNRPLIYTAAHCNDTGEQAPQQVVYRFGYEGLICDHPGGNPPPNRWVSFTGATLRASRGYNEFMLVELNQSLSRIEVPIAFAGWNRSTSLPSQTTTLHHAAGDVMKISHDARAPTTASVVLPPLG